MTRAVFGRLFLISLLLVGSAAVALFATRTGYNIARSADPERGTVTCLYWLGFGLHRSERRLSEAQEESQGDCPLLLRNPAF